MSRKAQPERIVNETHYVRCADGSQGIRREEVWTDASGRITKYNLAFIHHGLCLKDHGRVLGFDNAHGCHERHFMGNVEEVEFKSYAATVSRFQAEMTVLKEKA